MYTVVWVVLRPLTLSMLCLCTLYIFALPAHAQLGGLTSALVQQAEQTIITGVTKTVGERLGQGSPLLLDQHTALDAAPDLTDFRPKLLQPTAQDLGKRLPPGDYAVPVTGFCTQYSIHAPGRGLGYKIARVQGKQASAISALLVQGSLRGISPYTLNADAWRIQDGVPLSQWSSDDQAMIHTLIPSHEKDLQGDFLQQLHATYDSKSTVKFLGMKKRIPGLPSFEEMIGMMGDVGKTVMQLEAARQVLTDKTISAERLPDALFVPQGDGLPRVLPPSTDPSPSPWAEVQPGVFARYTILDGNMGRNLYEFRVTPAATQQGGAASNPAHPITLAGFPPNAAGLTLGAITGMGDPSGNNAALNIGYPIGQGAQALIAVPILAPPGTAQTPDTPTSTTGNDPDEPDLCPSDKLMKEGFMQGKPQQAQDNLRKLYYEALGIKDKLKARRNHFLSTLDAKDMFSTFYYHTTVNGLNLINQGQLNHPDVALEQIVKFYDAYEFNYDSQPSVREAHWKLYYETAQKLTPDISNSASLGVVLLTRGAQAHIFYDLPRALRDVLNRQENSAYPQEELKTDFYRFDDVFSMTTVQSYGDLSKAINNRDGTKSSGVVTDLVPGWLGSAVAIHDRHNAWDRAAANQLPSGLKPQPQINDDALEAEGRQSCPEGQQ